MLVDETGGNDAVTSRVLKRRYANVEPSANANASCSALSALPLLSCPYAGELGNSAEVVDGAAAALPTQKRSREAFPLSTTNPFSPSSDIPGRSELRRQLTPRISWMSLLSDSREDLTKGEAACITPRRQPASNRFGSPPCSPVMRRKGLGIRSSPERPSKVRDHSVDEDRTETTGRFTREFENATVVGSGHFSVVYKARNRIDSQEYAIKRTKQPLARGAQQRQATLHEALALASVAIDSSCPYIVRYFSSWIEEGRLFIQTEFCEGSLKDRLVSLRKTRPDDPRMDEKELTAVIRDVCMGLGVLHGKNLVHLDVKPENILEKRVSPTLSQERAGQTKIHKIADLGLATAAIGSGCDEISEGDSRYLAREVLQGRIHDLPKADVFSLGLMCYELATNPKELPCNGDDWHRLRDGQLEQQAANHLSKILFCLLQQMVGPVATERPPCAEILNDPAVGPQKLSGEDSLVVAQLQQQLRKVEQKMATAEEKADKYWSELLHMKRQEMLREGPEDSLAEAKRAAPSRPWGRSLTA